MLLDDLLTHIGDAADLGRVAMKCGLPRTNILLYRRHAAEWFAHLDKPGYRHLGPERRLTVADGLARTAYVMLSAREGMDAETFTTFVGDLTEILRMALKRGLPGKGTRAYLQSCAEEWMGVLSEERYERLDQEQRLAAAGELGSAAFNLLVRYSEAVRDGAWPPSP